MSRTREAEHEEKVTRREIAVGRVLMGGLQAAVLRAGGEMHGLSVKFGPYEAFMTIKAVLPAGPMIAFVGSETLDGVFLKAEREAATDRLKWQPDKYAKNGSGK